MSVEAGQVAIVRFPLDALPVPRVALVHAFRGDQVLVAKWRGPYGGTRRWSKTRWVPAADIAREASAREAVIGVVIDPIPPRKAA